MKGTLSGAPEPSQTTNGHVIVTQTNQRDNQFENRLRHSGRPTALARGLSRYLGDGVGLATFDTVAAPDLVAAPRRSMPVAALLLLAALAAGVRAQGAFYAGGQLVVGVLVVAAAVAALRSRRIRGREFGLPGVFASMLAAWSIASDVVAHHAAAALPGVALLAAILVTFAIVARLDATQRGWFVDAITVIGVAAGLSGWVGVVAHVAPLAHVDQGLWRAATTLTYANAAAGLLVPIAFVALVRLAESVSRCDRAVRSVAATALLVSIAATFSRGGAVAMLAGLVVLALVPDRRAIGRALVGPAVGASIGVAGLLVGVPQNAHSHVVAASALLVVGIGVAAAIASLATSRQLVLIVGAAIVAAAVAIVMSPSTRHAALTIAHPRLTTTSDDRAHESSAALSQIEKRPLLGAGSESQTLQWSAPDGSVMIDRYAHDEYLQVAWKSGVVGLALLVAMFGAFAARIRRGHRQVSSAMWAGAVAGLCGLAASSALDFLWHVPVIPLVGAVLAGLCAPTKGISL
jgi:O-antigen ligase